VSQGAAFAKEQKHIVHIRKAARTYGIGVTVPCWLIRKEADGEYRDPKKWGHKDGEHGVLVVQIFKLKVRNKPMPVPPHH
jgi:hypothetical protein